MRENDARGEPGLQISHFRLKMGAGATGRVRRRLGTFREGSASTCGNFASMFGEGGVSNFYLTPHRDYEPTLGRCLSADSSVDEPVGPGGIKVVNLADPQTWNLYAYVTDNPTTLNDPNGLGAHCTGQNTEHNNVLTCEQAQAAAQLTATLKNSTQERAQEQSWWRRSLSYFYFSHYRGGGLGGKVRVGPVHAKVEIKHIHETTFTTHGSTTEDLMGGGATAKFLNLEAGVQVERTQVIMKNGGPITEPSQLHVKVGKFEGSSAQLGVGVGGCAGVCAGLGAGIQLDQLWNGAVTLYNETVEGIADELSD